MKKIYPYFWLSLSLILLYLLFLYRGHFFRQSEPLQDWIIGKWSGERVYKDNTGVHIEEIRLEFIRPDILVYNSSLSTELEFGVVFRYNFVSENDFDLSGRLRDSWTATRTGDSLLVSSGIWRNQTVTLKRVLGFERLIVLILGLLVIGIFFYKPSADSKISAINTSDNRPNIFALFINFGLHLLILFVGYKAGEFLAIEFSSTKALLNQGLPWHSIILVEVSLSLLFIGLKVATSNFRFIKTPIYAGKVKYYLGMLLIGGSFFGTYIGLLRLVVLYLFPLVANHIT